MDELDLDFWVRKGSGVDNCLTLDSDLDSDLRLGLGFGVRTCLGPRLRFRSLVF